MISPNALRIFEAIGVYQPLKSKGFTFRTLTFMSDDTHEISGTYDFGDEQKYGYDALRVHRSELVGELRKAVAEKGITINYGAKFSHVVSEDDKAVTFMFAGGKAETASLLIGADGIHSKVRRYIAPGVQAAYSGFLGVTYAFPASKLRLPSGQEEIFSKQPVTLTAAPPRSAFVTAPQNADGSDIFAGRQFKYPAPAAEDSARDVWEKLDHDKAKLKELLNDQKEEWSDVVQSALEAVEEDRITTWPFHTLPKLESWASNGGRVIVLGDSAHAVPPTAGQGANQGAEDAFGFAALLKQLGSGAVGGDAWKKVIANFADYRKSRVEKVLELNAAIDKVRMGITKGEVKWELDWLYQVDVEGEVRKIGSEAI